MRRLLKKNKEERLTAEVALKDPWFLDIKNSGDDELIRSVCLNKNENSFNPKLSVNFTPVPFQHMIANEAFKKPETEVECFKILNEIKEEAEMTIFGMEEALKI